MRIPRPPHSWSVTPKRAVAIQRELAGRIVTVGEVRSPTLVAGADLAFSLDQTQCIAGVVVWEVESGQIVEQHVASRPVRFPYVPGLLSFREAPSLVAVLRKLRCEPDVFMFDGHGLAHPRRFGLACHLGLLIDRPSVGCAKSVLVGSCPPLPRVKGATVPLRHRGERIGVAVRTRDKVRPVYVSVGHRISLEAAVAITLMCSTGYRLPEPTRHADKLVARERKRTT